MVMPQIPANANAPRLIATNHKFLALSVDIFSVFV